MGLKEAGHYVFAFLTTGRFSPYLAKCQNEPGDRKMHRYCEWQCSIIVEHPSGPSGKSLCTRMSETGHLGFRVSLTEPVRFVLNRTWLDRWGTRAHCAC